jgi:hypothetical protein
MLRAIKTNRKIDFFQHHAFFAKFKKHVFFVYAFVKYTLFATTTVNKKAPRIFLLEHGMINCLFVCFGFYVTSTQDRSYRDVQALLVEEDLRCPSVHYFRHERAHE